MSAASFANATGLAFHICYYTAYVLTTLLAFGGLIFLFLTRRHRNLLLITLNMVILVDCVTFILFELYQQTGSPHFAWSLSINTSADTLSHYIVAFAYIKVILELNALLDKDILLNNVEKIEAISKKKRHLVYASFVAVSLCLVDGALCYVGFLEKNMTIVVLTQFGCVILDISFLAIWGYALITLNKKVKHEKLIPNRQVFTLHGLCLVSYVFFNLLFLVTLSLTAVLEGEQLFIDQSV